MPGPGGISPQEEEEEESSSMGRDLSGSTRVRGRVTVGEERDWQEGFHEENESGGLHYFLYNSIRVCSLG